MIFPSLPSKLDLLNWSYLYSRKKHLKQITSFFHRTCPERKVLVEFRETSSTANHDSHLAQDDNLTLSRDVLQLLEHVV